MTEELFRDDATLLHCQGTLTAVGEIGIELDRSVFYPLGGGQAGDSGWLRRADGAELRIADTRKGPAPGQILHLPEPGSDLTGWCARQAVTASLDAARRQAHRRFHTATHLLCALVPHPVYGCSITAGYARMALTLPPQRARSAGLAGVRGPLAPSARGTVLAFVFAFAVQCVQGDDQPGTARSA